MLTKVNTVLTKKNTLLTKFNTLLTKKNTLLTKFDTLLTKKNTVVTKFNTVLTKKKTRYWRRWTECWRRKTQYWQRLTHCWQRKAQYLRRKTQYWRRWTDYWRSLSHCGYDILYIVWRSGRVAGCSTRDCWIEPRWCNFWFWLIRRKVVGKLSENSVAWQRKTVEKFRWAPLRIEIFRLYRRKSSDYLDLHV